MRAFQALTFDKTATITRAVYVDDGAGGTVPGTPITFTSSCRLSPNKTADSEAVLAGRIDTTGMWEITFPALTDIRASDDITVGSQQFEIARVYGPKSRESARMVLAIEKAA
jgi:hypothetical protein